MEIEIILMIVLIVLSAIWNRAIAGATNDRIDNQSLEGQWEKHSPFIFTLVGGILKALPAEAMGDAMRGILRGVANEVFGRRKATKKGEPIDLGADAPWYASLATRMIERMEGEGGVSDKLNELKEARDKPAPIPPIPE